jgi:hypothetical protein
MSHSTHAGFRCPFFTPSERSACTVSINGTVPLLCAGASQWLCVPSPAVGVRQNPYPFPFVRGADGASRNNKRPCFVAKCFQVRKHCVEPQSDVPNNILSKHPSGPEFFDKPTIFRPEMAVILRASTLPGTAEGLARIAPADKVNWPCIPGVQVAHIFVDGHTWPVLAKHGSAVGVDFAEGDGSHPGSFESKGESADAGKEVEDKHYFPASLPSFARKFTTS